MAITGKLTVKNLDELQRHLNWAKTFQEMLNEELQHIDEWKPDIELKFGGKQ
ncbi:hypothetical protein ACRYI5_03430 [Furfurilactobacillus sp. WILCCON 0119]